MQFFYQVCMHSLNSILWRPSKKKEGMDVATVRWVAGRQEIKGLFDKLLEKFTSIDKSSSIEKDRLMDLTIDYLQLALRAWAEPVIQKAFFENLRPAVDSAQVIKTGATGPCFVSACLMCFFVCMFFVGSSSEANDRRGSQEASQKLSSLKNEGYRLPFEPLNCQTIFQHNKKREKKVSSDMQKQTQAVARGFKHCQLAENALHQL
jgi:hypothetical protein